MPDIKAFMTRRGHLGTQIAYGPVPTEAKSVKMHRDGCLGAWDCHGDVSGGDAPTGPEQAEKT